MKFLRNFFDKRYEKTNKKWYPLIESFETLVFTPNHTTKSGSHIRDGIDLKRTMMFVIVAMVPALLFGIWNVGQQHFIALGQEVDFMEKIIHGAIRVIPIIAVSYTVGLAVEFIFGIIKGHALHEGYLVSGMLIPLIMPVDTPLWMIAVATVFGVVIGKEVFGGNRNECAECSANNKSLFILCSSNFYVRKYGLDFWIKRNESEWNFGRWCFWCNSFRRFGLYDY